MTERIYDLAILVAVWGAYVRVACVLLASLRTLRNRGRFVTFKMGWAEIATVPEPFLLAAATYALHAHRPAALTVSFSEVAAAVTGAVLVLAAWDVTLWAFRSWPSIFVGHGVLEGHRLVTRGAYGFVRHPVYLGVLLFWLGLALAFTSSAVLLVTVLYVLPSYLLYMRSEETMMLGAFGEAYRAYQRAVPFLVPRLGPRGVMYSEAASGARATAAPRTRAPESRS